MLDCLRPLSPRPMAREVLVLCPFAGGGASVFREWAGLLPDWIEPWAVQLPAREDRLSVPPFEAWKTMTDAVAEDIRLAASARPVSFYGHSFGALVALSIGASQEARRIILGAPPPRLDLDLPETDDAILKGLVSRFGDLPASFENPEIRDVVMPALKADLALLRLAELADRTPDLVLLGQDDPSATAMRSRWAAAPIKTIPAGHYFAATHAAATVHEVTASLAQAS